MDTQSLPLVPFGKYKGQPITKLMDDTKYLEWCKQQGWFQNFPIVYNICVNQTITSSIQDSKTPEHNKLQNLFLDRNNQKKLINKLFGLNIGVSFKTNFEMLIINEEFKNCFDSSTIEHWGCDGSSLINKNNCTWVVPEFNRLLGGSKIIFEDKYYWDFIFYYNEHQTISFETKCDIENLTENLTSKNLTTMQYLYQILAKYNFKYNNSDYFRPLDTYINKENKYKVLIDAVYCNITVCCELKPFLSDDYPCVLRKLKTQINLTENDKTTFEKMNKKYILIIGKFTSTTTSITELRAIFKQSNIRIIFTDEIFESSKKMVIEHINTELSEKNFIEENKTLKHNLFETQQNLLQSENKIKQLEEEIQLLKTQKQSKTIKDYFVKK